MTDDVATDSTDARRTDALLRAARDFGARGWTPATSGNYSLRRADGSILITRSGCDKRHLGRDDLMVINADGRPLEAGARASAEAGLHVQIYREFADVGAVLHVHSPHATLASRRAEHRGTIALTGYELLKAFAGVTSHDQRIELPVVANDQDIERLAATVAPRLAIDDAPPGYLIAGHGLYAWGRDVADAARHLEAFEFLLQLELMEAR